MIAATEQDYLAMRDSVAVAVQGARVLALVQSEVEVFAEVYYTLTRTVDPRVAAAMGAAAIIQLAARSEDDRYHE
ncbi:MAG: hypothetical protein AUI14_03180 [Actinobacteria bacterium 13_2_20CM_2_71_6]|nr:MAG: hypothetical protein AUI14_03180 [Actinobacteria bacterium 13_2_20CM_2_71_6]